MRQLDSQCLNVCLIRFASLHLFRNSLRLFFLQHQCKYSDVRESSIQFHQIVRISRLRHTKSHQNWRRAYQSLARLLLRSHLLKHLFENIMNFTWRNHISLWMIWIACLMRSLNHLICNNIKIAFCLREASIFVNLTRSSFILLSKICSKCSMRNSKKRIYFKVKRTFLLENSSQNNRESSLTSSLQSIESRRLVKSRKAQKRKVWNNSSLRNRFALLSLIALRNRSFRHTKCLTSSILIQWSIVSKMKSSKSHMLSKFLRVNFALLRLLLIFLVAIACVLINSTSLMICINIYEWALQIIHLVNQWE